MMDCRQNVLTTINNLLKRMTHFQSRPDQRHLTRFLSLLISDLELLRNDLILLFNQNFYLRCKLDQKTQELHSADKKLEEMSSRMDLTLEMTRQRYEKQIQSLRFKQFVKGQAQDSLHSNNDWHSPTLPAKGTDFPRLSKEQQKQPSHQPATIKKPREFQQLKSSPPKDPFFLTNLEEEREFDLELRTGLLSEKPVFSNNKVSEEMVKSSEMEQQGKKKRGRTARKDQVLCHRKKKSEQLAQLVAQQFKVPPFKQKYFSTDLL